MAKNDRQADKTARQRRMRWPVVYAAAPLLAVGVALGLAALVAEEDGQHELAGTEEESTDDQRQATRDEAPAGDETPVRQPTDSARQDAPVAAPTPAEPPVAATSPVRDSTEQEGQGYVDPDAPVVEETAQHHVGDRRDPDTPAAAPADESARHVGELLDPDAP